MTAKKPVVRPRERFAVSISAMEIGCPDARVDVEVMVDVTISRAVMVDVEVTV